MADKNKRKTASYWEDQINKGLSWRMKVSHERFWDKYRAYYEHDFTNPNDPHFNLVYTLGSSLIPTLVFQSPGIINTARRPEFIYWAKFFDGIDNWLVDEMEVQETLEEAVLDAYLYNLVAIELNYDMGQVGSEMDFEPLGSMTLDRTRKTNQPWIDRIEPRRLLLAPGTKNMRNCWWYAKNVMVPTEVLKNMKGLVQKNVEATHMPEQVKGTTSTEEERSSDRDQTSVWIIHEQEDNQVMWLTSTGKFIVEPEDDPMQIDGLPAHLLSFNRGASSIWGTPDVAYIETQQIEGDESRYDGMIQSKAANLKGFYDSTLLDEDQISQFITSKALGMVPVNVPMDKSLGDAVQLIQPHIQSERFEYQKNLINDAQLVIGMGPNQFGNFSTGRNTKFEAQVVEERTFLRTGLRRDKIGKLIGKLFSQANQIIVREWKASTVQRVVGIEGAVHWVKALPSEFQSLRAQLVTKVNVESLAPVSRERRKQEMLDVMNIVAKFAGAVDGLNIVPVLQNFLSQFEWLDVMNTLPQANEQDGPANLSEFQTQQQGIPQGQLAGLLQQNLGSLNSLIGQLPSGGSDGTNQ